MSEINVTLNGIPVKGNKGETILALAERNNIVIPTLCHDKRLEPFSSCFVCVVEIVGMRTLQPSCSTRIAEAMVIDTENERVKKSRKTALELMLSNHYADCTGPCKQSCPAGVDVQGYISMIEKGKFREAIEIIKETNPLPAICGRVCVRPCEVACRRNLLDEGAAVGVDYLKRFAADKDLESADKYIPKLKPKTGKNVAVIGAGPGGLAAAFFLQKEGHQVDIYEANPHGGGMLRYGIPEYRLPNDVLDKEIENIKELGVNVFYNSKLGDNLKYKDIHEKYNATILAIGSQAGTNIGCEGDEHENVLSGIDFLRTMELTGKRYNFKGKKVAVIGGGNTAMDCCRSALRCGAEKVYIIYRRTEKEMPANPIEIHESKLEGVEYLFLTAPHKINKGKKGELASMTCQKMTLGEPDASGRRRPVVEPGSDFDVALDYVIAAIGQKTVLDFADDVNTITKEGELKANKWGDIDADKETLQTGVKNMFAAGDGVTGPATLIEAVAQGKIAALSCHQYLTGQPIQRPIKEFISRKDNFKKQVAADYTDKFAHQKREEMPTLPKKSRNNFNEVELGYSSEDKAIKEACRCFECGCEQYYDCDLKRLATEYSAEQNVYSGEFKHELVDFRHPFIEIDNNKCILCSRCIRICSDVVGANALGLVERGFNTYVAPSMGDSLTDTNCESCGLCISACPTAAINENFKFKPGPVKLSEATTICNYCSVGCDITLNHKTGFVMKVTGNDGLVNTDGNICKYAKFGYSYINDKKRITKPLLKVKGKFEEISFENAFDLIAKKIKSAKPDQNAFFAGARLTNAELFSVQRLARLAAKTNNIGSFHYLNRGEGYRHNSLANVPFDEISGASRIYLLGSEINRDNAVVGFMINGARKRNQVPVELITNLKNSAMQHKVDHITKVKSYYHFIKALNHYILSSGLENRLFIDTACADFDTYKKALLKENYDEIVKLSGLSKTAIASFAKSYNNEMNAIIVFSEKELSSNACSELFNLTMITGKLGKTSNGLISLKEKNNSQGLIDMGISEKLGVGGVAINDESLIKKMQYTWNTETLPMNTNNLFDLLESHKLKNILVFGEDPIGTAKDKKQAMAWFENSSFVMVQDYFITETAAEADLILPATLPVESDGSFTNTQKVIQIFQKQLTSKVVMNNMEQIAAISNSLEVKAPMTVGEIMSEAISLFPEPMMQLHYKFCPTINDNSARMFDYGCDTVVKIADEYFEKQ